MKYLKHLFTLTVAVGATATMSCGYAVSDSGQHNGDLEWIRHVVVIYMENHSFDNLYGMWGSVNGKPVNGLANADAAHATQVNQGGTPYLCLLQNDPNLTSPTPLPTTCVDNTTSTTVRSAFANRPFDIDPYIPNRRCQERHA